MQFNAAGILDSVNCAIESLSDDEPKQARALLRSLSDFDVKVDVNFSFRTPTSGDLHPVLSVLHNIIVRGLPTKASPFIEDCFNEFGNKLIKTTYGEVEYEAASCWRNDIFIALHALDKRLILDENSYNTGTLGSNFEEEFILKKTPAFLRHLLLPQRFLQSITGSGFKNQSVDFAVEFPYRDTDAAEPNGIVYEIDGPSHSSVAQQVQDVARDEALRKSEWLCIRIKDLNDSSENFDCINKISFLRNVARAYQKSLNDPNWIKHLQFALSPIGVARIQKIIVEAILSGNLDIFSKNELKVLVLEQDVPCSVMAFEEFSQMFNTLTSLSRKYESLKFPKVSLDVVSTKPFSESPLHKIKRQYTTVKVYTEKDNDTIRNTDYDLVIDIGIMRRSEVENVSFSEFKCSSRCYFKIRSSHYHRTDRVIYTSDVIEYKPVVTKTPQGEYIELEETSELLRYFLRMLFRKENFRCGQLPIINRALQNKCVIGLLPTGGGKSLTYQLATMLQPGVSIVVDPLIALMKDQYDGLVRLGIDTCTFINTTISPQERTNREAQMATSRLQFVFLAPERLRIYEFRKKLESMCQNGVYFAYGVIDEVHCVSEWGHDFRFSYLHLGKNMCRYALPKQGRITLLGLTATASFDVLADVERELSGDGAFELDSDVTVRDENTNRLELQYRIERVPLRFNGLSDKNFPDFPLVEENKWDFYKQKSEYLREFLKTIPDLIQRLQTNEALETIKKRFAERQNLTSVPDVDLRTSLPTNFFAATDTYSYGGIIFCPHKRKTGLSVGINAGKLRADNLKVGTFIGGNEASDISFENLDKFKANKLPIMVATKAFGMGIDKPDVRFTINMNHPSSLEGFVQEAGRAGRDRKIALATILFSDYHLVRVNGNCPLSHYSLRLFKDKWNHNKNLQEVLNSEGIKVEERYIDCIKPEDVRAGGFIQDPDCETVMYFYNENFKGIKEEKKKIHQILSRTPIRFFWGNDAEEKKCKETPNFLNTVLSASADEELVAFISSVSANTNKTKNDIEKEKASIEKAIYRMCCIGLIDDVTQDYKNERFRFVVKKKPDGAYYRSLQVFLERYYTKERARLEIDKARNHKGENEIQRCLGYLTEFVYEKIAEKRLRAIDDMRTFCLIGLENRDWLQTNEELKDFIYYYFNSKYAREGYQTDDGQPFSLIDDTENGKKCSYNILFKYLRVIDDDIVGTNSPKDNIKHLQGAVRLIRRALTDSNPVLDFLNVFCLLYLKVGKNENLQQELKKSYINGYIEFYARTSDWEEFRRKMEDYKDELTRNNRNVATKDEINRLKEWDLESELEIHSRWLKGFAEKYTKE